MNLVREKAQEGFFQNTADLVILTKTDNRHSLLSSDARTLLDAPHLGQTKFIDKKL